MLHACGAALRLQASVQKAALVLLDNTSESDVIPSLRVVVEDLFINSSSCSQQSSNAASAACVNVSLDVHAALSASYFNSSLDIEEPLLAVRCMISRRDHLDDASPVTCNMQMSFRLYSR